MLERMWRKGSPITRQQECNLLHLLWRTVWILLKKTKDRATIWVAIPFLGIYPERKYSLKGHMHPNIYCSTIYNSQDREAT